MNTFTFPKQTNKKNGLKFYFIEAVCNLPWIEPVGFIILMPVSSQNSLQFLILLLNSFKVNVRQTAKSRAETKGAVKHGRWELAIGEMNYLIGLFSFVFLFLFLFLVIVVCFQQWSTGGELHLLFASALTLVSRLFFHLFCSFLVFLFVSDLLFVSGLFVCFWFF